MASELRVDKIVPTGGAPTGGAGGIIQVVQVVKTDTFSTTGVTYVDITGLTKTISYTAGHKILVMFNGNIGMDESAQMGNIRISTPSAVLHAATGDASGSRQRATTSGRHYDTASISSVSFCYIDSPSGTSNTYKVQMCSANPGRVTYLNRSGADDNALYRTRTASTLTLMELSA